MSDLNFRILWGSLDLTDHPFGIEWGADVGAPAKVYEALSVLLADGEIEVSTRDSNRTMSFTILAEAPDLLSHSELEAQLAIEAGKDRNTLTLIPGDMFGPASVFDTYEAELVWLRSDDLEIAGYRRYQVTLPAYPFPRSSAETVVEAIGSGTTPPAPVTITVDNCTSTTDWSSQVILAPHAIGAGSPFGPSVSGGGVRSGFSWTGPGARTTASVKETRVNLSADMTSTPYLLVEVRAESPAASSISFGINGLGVDPIAQSGQLYWLDCSDVPVVTSFSAQATTVVSRETTPWVAAVTVYDISRTNVNPFVGTGRQQFRAIEVGGSQRSQGSLQVSHATSALGEVLVYTNQDDRSGYQPACRQFRTSGGGGPTPDSSTASGSYEPLDGGAPVIIEIPIGSVPQGTYSLMARIKGNTSSITGVSFSAATRVGSTDYGLRSGAKIIGTSNVWKLFELDRLTLPPTAVPAGSSAKVRLSLSSLNRLDLDEVYLFNTDIGDLSWVDCGTASPSAGGSSNRLWLDTASLDWPRPAALLGTQADRSDARHVDSITEHKAEGVHMLNPGRLNVFSLTTNALNAAVSLRHYRRWHSNAGS